jgi:nicotinamide-nucleotide amidase
VTGWPDPFDELLRGTDGTVSPGRPALIVAALAAAGLTVAAAESLTGGLLTAALTSVPGSSAVVRGGLVVYATDLKESLAGVDSRLLADRGPVDPEVAMALAEGARERCGADIGVALTGVAGPDAQDGKPPGTWFVALASAIGATTGSSAARSTPAGAAVGRRSVRADAVNAALDLLDAASREQSRATAR